MRSSRVISRRRARWPELALAFALAAPLPAAPGDPLVCKGCHGMAGEGRPEAGYPPIAGQPPLYLHRQLEAYADGRRESRVMSPIARWLEPAARERMARHFAAMPPAPRGSSQVNAPERGRLLAERGDERLRVQACANCHGPRGRGQPPSGPYLAGLDAGYLERQLRAWKEGARDSDPSGAMGVIARALGDDDLRAVAAYYAAMRPSDPPPSRSTPRSPG